VKVSSLLDRWTGRAQKSAAPASTKDDSTPCDPLGFFLCRIIGNDLVPRHALGQSRTNIEFILTHEPDFEGVEKHWIINRIQNADEEARLIDLLESRGQAFTIIPFDESEYLRAAINCEFLPNYSTASFPHPFAPERRWKTIDAALRREKNLYAINNNGARNLALAIGKSRARWVLPWDGNAFLTERAWQQIANEVRRLPSCQYFTVPMARIVDNLALLDTALKPEAAEEPQLIFRNDAALSFDERFPYGRRPKVELLWRLGVAGPWDTYNPDPTDFPRPARIFGGKVPQAGWVARLSSGMPDLEFGERANSLRNAARADAIIAFIDDIDRRLITQLIERADLVFYDRERLSALASKPDALSRTIIEDADAARRRGPFSVTFKTTIAPSGDPQDYFHIAPYWWPDPEAKDGQPYVRRDGQRMPGTDLYAPGSEKYDRSSLQRLFDDTTSCALAWAVTGSLDYANHAAGLIRTWFLDKKTCMNPHMRYAQVRAGHLRDFGSAPGIAEAKDFYYFLDAVRLVREAKALSPEEIQEFKLWLRQYRGWLRSSKQALAAASRANNVGTTLDLQAASIAVFLEDGEDLHRIVLRAKIRMQEQFSAYGDQPHEADRRDAWHYRLFNLAAWTSLARIVDKAGGGIWEFSLPDGRNLGLAIRWLLDNAPDTDGEGPSAFRSEQLYPLFRDYEAYFARRLGPYRQNVPTPEASRFSPEIGYAPYWQLSAAQNYPA
jgi:Alginate lyase